jgi:hypothetical protein
VCTDAGKPVPFQEKDVSVNTARKPSADKTFAARLEPGKDKEKDREAKEKEREKPKEPPAPVNCLRIKNKNSCVFGILLQTYQCGILGCFRRRR